MATVMSYDTGSELEGVASEGLVEASADAGDTGAVAAYRDDAGVWHYVPDSQIDHYRCHLREEVVTVFVL